MATICDELTDEIVNLEIPYINEQQNHNLNYELDPIDQHLILPLSLELELENLSTYSSFHLVKYPRLTSQTLESMPQILKEHFNESIASVTHQAAKTRKSQSKNQGKKQVKVDCRQKTDADMTLATSMNKSPSEPSPKLIQNKARLIPFVLPGLAGRTPFFRYSMCADCNFNRLVFSFGQEKYKDMICFNCIIKSGHADQIDSIISSESRLSFSLSDKDYFNGKRQSTTKDHKNDKSEEEMFILNQLLEVKQVEIQYMLSKTTNCLTICKKHIEVESKLLAMKFINEHIECLMKLAHILRLPVLQQKLDCLDSNEQSYFKAEIQKSLGATYQTEQKMNNKEGLNFLNCIPSRKGSEADILYLLNSSKGMPPLRKSSFFLDLEESTAMRPFLGKRDRKKSNVSNDDAEDADHLTQVFPYPASFSAVPPLCTRLPF